MGKKHKQKRPHTSTHHGPPPDAARPSEVPLPPTPTPPAEAAPPPDAETPAPLRGRLRRLLPDIVKAALALAAIGLGVAIWLKPPLIRDTVPYVSYTLGGQTFTNAVLYHPLSIPTRFYVGLPAQVADRYQWFTVDRRREIAALADGAPQDTFLGWPAVRRNAPLGLDLEFRKLDGSEWRVFFLPEAIVFSNDTLAVRLDIKKPTEAPDGLR